MDLDIFDCDELKLESFKHKEIRNQYSLFWNDFVSMRINLIDGKLKGFLQNTLNISTNEINVFYKYFEYCRVFYVTLSMVDESQFNKTSNDTNVITTSDILSLSDIYRYIVTFWGVFILLTKRDNIWVGGYGLASQKV